MSLNERIESFLHSMIKDEEGITGIIEQEALTDQVPIIRKETKDWLKTMLLIKKPERILEVGTAVGFSSIFMCQHISKTSHITTIEKWEPRIEQAKINFARTKVEDKVTLLEGDAAEILHELAVNGNQTFDFIFMDAAKGQYIHFLPDVIQLLEKDGVLISDNVLQDGEILDSRYVVERRNRTIHSRMREYLYELKNNNSLDTSVIPLGDGVALSVKLDKKEEMI